MKSQRVLLGEFADRGEIDIQTGPFGTQLRASDYTPDGTPVINVRNIGYGSLRPDKLEYVPESVVDRLGQHILATNDIVFGRKGAVDRHLLVDDSQAGWMQGSDCIRIRVQSKALLVKYLSCALCLDSHKRWMLAQCSNKATMASLNQDVICRIPIFLPDPGVQREIVRTLSSYDDLIENNQRRIQLLEQAARLLYKEWFVHLRFPGHEHVKITDGVPEEWERIPVSSFCTVGRGGSPRPIKNFLDGTVPWYKIGDATASESPFVFSTAESIIEEGVRKSVLLPPQELILSNSATCGIPYFTGITGCIHDGWLYFKNLERVSKWLLYCALYAKQREILMGIGEGATQKNLNTDYIGRQVLVLPKKQGLLIAFDEIVKPLFRQIFTLAQSSNNLVRARDLLLPRLMNGEIPV